MYDDVCMMYVWCMYVTQSWCIPDEIDLCYFRICIIAHNSNLFSKTSMYPRSNFCPQKTSIDFRAKERLLAVYHLPRQCWQNKSRTTLCATWVDTHRHVTSRVRRGPWDWGCSRCWLILLRFGPVCSLFPPADTLIVLKLWKLLLEIL